MLILLHGKKKNVLRGWGGETDVNNAGGVLLNNSSAFFSLIIYTQWRARVCVCVCFESTRQGSV